jgi:hypothetical protein
MNLLTVIVGVAIILIAILYLKCEIDAKLIEGKAEEVIIPSEPVVKKPRKKYKKRKKLAVVAEKRPVGRPRKTVE